MAVISANSTFTTTFTNDELSLIVRGLIGRLRKQEIDRAQGLANQITLQRAEQFERTAEMLRDMIPKDDGDQAAVS